MYRITNWTNEILRVEREIPRSNEELYPSFEQARAVLVYRRMAEYEAAMLEAQMALDEAERIAEMEE